MKQLYTTLLVVAFLWPAATVFAKPYLPPTGGTIAVSGNPACVGGTAPLVTFSATTAPGAVSFTYTLDGAPLTATGNPATAQSVSMAVAGTHTYILISVTDSTGTTNISGQTQTVTVSAFPVADFSFVNNQCSGVGVQFNSTVSGSGPFTYGWDFGDSTTSANANPSHTFTSLGCGTQNFVVKLSVTNSSGCLTVVQKTVTIKQKPDIAFSDALNAFDPFSNCGNASAANPSYSITVSNASASSCISSYSINWGDGNSLPNISFPLSHTYAQLGAYTMTITAVGTNGCTNSKSYTIKNVSNPSGGITSPGSTQNLCAPTSQLQFAISNWGNNSPGTTYHVDYGDNLGILDLTQEVMVASSYYNSSSPAASSNYPIPYSYPASTCPNSSITATLTVTNACGSTPGTVSNISVLSKPEAEFSNPPAACVNTPVTFTNATALGYNQNCTQNFIFSWNFGDGSPIVTTVPTTAQNISHTYANPGNYTISLSASGYCGTTTKTHTICIESALVPQFTLSSSTGCAPLAITTTNTTNTANSCNTPAYLWSVTYTSSNCGSSSAFTYTSASTQTSAAPSFNFTNSGTYHIKLSATNSCGTVTSAEQTVVVKEKPQVSIAPISSLCGSSSATINPVATVTNCGVNAPVYSWSFPGGTPTTSSSATPSVTYSTTGTKTFTLTLTNECGLSATAQQTFSINTAVTANAGNDSTICVGGNTALTGTGGGGTGSGYTYSWTPSTGLSAVNIANPLASPSVTTTYTLTVKDAANCTMTDDVTVTVNNLTAGTVSAAQTLCSGDDPAALTTTVAATGAGTLSYQWQSSPNGTAFSDLVGATSSTYDPPVLVQTTYYRRVVTSILNAVTCTANSNVIAISVNTVTAGAITGNQDICTGGNPLAFTSNSTASAAGTLSYQWQSSTDNVSFNNINLATAANYDAPSLSQTTYYRRLATSTLNGIPCSATSNVLTVTVGPLPVISSQPLPAQTLCQNAAVQDLTIAATGGVGTISYQWFSNNSASTSGGTAVGTGSNYSPPTAVSGTTYYYCVATTPGAGCSVTSALAQVVVLPSPNFSQQPLSQNLCFGGTPALLTVAYQNGSSGGVYQWFSNTVNNTNGTAITGQTGPTYQPSGASTGTMFYYCVVTFGSGGCSSISSNVAAITVNEVPVVSAQNTTACSNVSFNITPSDAPAGTTFSWPAPSGTGFSGGSAASNQSAIGQTLTNTTNGVVTVTYNVTPKLGTCNGNPFAVTVTLNPSPVLPAAPQTICSGGSFTVNPLNSPPATIVPLGTTYSWPAPVMTPGLSGGTAGTDQSNISGTLTNATNTAQTATYTVTPKAGNCTGATFTIAVTVHPVPAIGPKTASICSGNSFSVTPLNTPDTVPAGTTYTWTAPVINPPGAISGGSANSTATNSIGQSLTNTTTSPATATYTVTPKAGNCTGTAFDLVVTVSPLPTVNDIAPQTLCNGNMTTIIAFTGSNSTTVYNWVNNNPAIGLAASGTGDIAAFTATNSGNTALTATLIVTPSLGGCDGASKNFTITVNPAPIVAFSQQNQTICSGSTSAAVLLSSPTPNTSFSWTAVQPAGISGVATSGTTSIPAQILVNTSSSPVVVTYIALATTVGIPCPGAPTIYSVTVNPVPFTTGSQAFTSCSGVALNFSPSDGSGNNIPSGTQYTWTAPTGTGFSGGSAQNTPQTGFNQILTNTTANPVTATYTITPQFNGCIGLPFQLALTVNPAAAIADYALTWCSGQTFTLNPAVLPNAVVPAGTTYGWGAPTMGSNISGGISANGQPDVNGQLSNSGTTNQTALYTVTPLSPTGNCIGAPFNVTVTVTPPISATGLLSSYNGFPVSTSGATDGFIHLTTAGGSGNYSYNWSGPAGYSASTQNIDNIAAGSYTVTISDGLCNPLVLTFLLAEPLPLLIGEVTANHVNLNCFGDTNGVIEVAVTQASIAPFDYVLQLQDGTIIESVTNSNALNYVFDNLGAGIYTILVTDANGTTKQISGIVITQPATALAIASALVSAHNGFQISCNGASDGSINLTISGGYPAYGFLWSGPNGFSATTEDLAGLPPGTYSVIVEDTTGICNVTGTYVIAEPQPLALTAVVSDYNGHQISCFGYNNGSISITSSGGTGTYVFNWTGSSGFSAQTEDLQNLYAGTYHLVITDTNGCSLDGGSFVLTEPQLLEASENHVDILCNGASTGAINATVNGGTPMQIAPGVFDYNYSWTGPNGFVSSQQDLVNVPAGSYTLTVTDASGCIQTLSAVLTEPPGILIQATTTPIECYGDNNATITISLSGGTAPYGISWSNFGEGLYQDNLAAGDYLVTVTDALGCVKTLNVNIPEAPIFTVNPVVTQISCFGENDGSINLNFVGGIAPIQFAWVDSPTAGVFRNNLGPGTYTVNISDAKPCYITQTFTIIEPQPLIVSANLTNALDCDEANSGAINLLVAGGTTPYVYNWSNGTTTEDLANIPAGNYLVTVTDAHGCTATGQYAINRQPPLVVDVKTQTDFDCETHYVKQSFLADVSGGVPPYQLQWSSGTISGANDEIMDTQQNGAVILTATDAFGCTASYSFNVDIPELGMPGFVQDSFAYQTYGYFSISDPVQFTSEATGDYEAMAWDFGDGSFSTEENPVHIYLKPGDYVVRQTVTYPLGCVYVKIITLMVDKGYALMIPNGFSPNDDGVNDSFMPVFKGLKSVELEVYTTWGERIYDEKGETLKGWPGELADLQSENGNYYYKITATTFYGAVITEQGPFVLIK